MERLAVRLMAALDEALAHARGEDQGATRVHLPDAVDVSALRRRAGLSQGEFAHRLAVPVARVREWEQDRRLPDGPARILLMLLEERPDLAAQVLGRDP